MKPVGFEAGFESDFKTVMYAFSGPVHQQPCTGVEPLF